MREFIFDSAQEVDPTKFDDLKPFLHKDGMTGFLRNTDDLLGLSRNMRSSTDVFQDAQKELETGQVTDGRVAEFFLDQQPEGDFGHAGYFDYLVNCWEADAGVVVHPDFLMEIVMSQVRQLTVEIPKTLVQTPHGPMTVPIGMTEMPPRFVYQLSNDPVKQHPRVVLCCSLPAIRVLGDHSEWMNLVMRLGLMARAFQNSYSLHQYLSQAVTTVQKMIDNLDNSEFWAKFFWMTKHEYNNPAEFKGHVSELVVCNSVTSLVRFQLLYEQTTQVKSYYMVSGTLSSRLEGKFAIPQYFESRTVVDREVMNVSPERQQNNRGLLDFKNLITGLDQNRDLHLPYQLLTSKRWLPTVDDRGNLIPMKTESEFMKDNATMLRLGSVTPEQLMKRYQEYTAKYQTVSSEYQKYTEDPEAFVAQQKAEQLRERQEHPNFWCHHAGLEELTSYQMKTFWLDYPVEAWRAAVKDQEELLQATDQYLNIIGPLMFGKFFIVHSLIKSIHNPMMFWKVARYLRERGQVLPVFQNAGQQSLHGLAHLNSFADFDPDIGFLMFTVWDMLFTDRWTPRTLNLAITKEFVRKVLEYDPDRMYKALQKFLTDCFEMKVTQWKKFPESRDQRSRDPDPLKHFYLCWYEGECRVEPSDSGKDSRLTEIFFECMKCLSDITDGRLGSDPEQEWILTMNGYIAEMFPGDSSVPMLSQQHLEAIRERHRIRVAVIAAIKEHIKSHPRKRVIWVYESKRAEIHVKEMNYDSFRQIFDFDAFSGNAADGFELYIQNREMYVQHRKYNSHLESYCYQMIDYHVVNAVQEVCAKMNCTVRMDRIFHDGSKPPQFILDQKK